MAAIGSVDVDKSSWLKWQIAVAIGAPVAIGIGYWYFVKNKKDVDSHKNESSKSDNCKVVPDSSVQENETKKTDKNSVEKTKTPPVSAPVTQTPLQLSQDLKNSGNSLFKSAKYLDAIKCYTEAIEICPPEEKDVLSTYYQNRAAAHEQLNNLEDVKKDCTSALELNAKYTKAYLRRAKACESTGDLKQCLEDITSVCILECFQNSSSLVMADRVLKQLGKMHTKEAIKHRRPVKPSKSFIKSYFLSFANDPIKHYFVDDQNNRQQQGLNGYSETESFTRDLLDKVKKSLVSENYEQIVIYCTEALEIAPENSLLEVLLLRGTTHILQAQHVLALADLKTIIDTIDGDAKVRANALIKCASLYIQTDEEEKCFANFKLAEQIDPQNSDVYHHRGQIYLVMDKLDESVADFKKAVELNPNYPIPTVQCLYAQYRVAATRGDVTAIDSIIQQFKSAIEKFPACTEAYTLYAQILTDQQKYFEEANKNFDTAIKLDPNNPTLKVQKALLNLQWTGDVNATVDMINEAIAVDENCEFCYETLGTIEVQRGNLQRAIELFDKALPLTKSELEMSHIYSLRDAAVAQIAVAQRLGLPISTPLPL